MHAHNRPFFSFFRSLLLPALAVSALTLNLELGPAMFTSSAVFAAADGSSASEIPTAEATAKGSAIGAAKGSIPTYRWNLSDDGLPLISLPDHIDSGLDLSLAYSMDQFEFPLFQSLYYNARAGKYILMVIRKDARTHRGDPSAAPEIRPEFIDLAPVNGPEELETGSKPSLRFTDKGGLKTLSTSDGTVYTFVTLADGELHCNRIKDRNGLVINLKYTNGSSLQAIADDRGRTISFSYTNDYVSSITQTWRAKSAKLKQTWAIADEVRFAHRPAAYAGPARTEPAKHIPSNAINPTYTEAMAASDSVLAAIFGGPGAIAAANNFEPAWLGSQYPLYRGDQIGDDGRILRGHLSFAMHLYGSADGTAETELYVPEGFSSHSSEPSPTDAAVTFFYPRLGNLANVTLAVFHVANFHISHEDGRVRIGSIGGRGGSVASYKHSHLEFYRGDTGLPSPSARVQLRIDPATVFTATPTTALQPTTARSVAVHLLAVRNNDSR
jgi:hypothetical protein